MAEPGGYLQWDEIDSVDWTVKSAYNAAQTGAMIRLTQQLCGTDEYVSGFPADQRIKLKHSSWKRNMVHTLSQHGFENASLYQFNDGNPMARIWNDMYFSTWEEFAKVVLKDQSGSHQLGAAAMDEVRDGSALVCSKLVWLARKV